LEETSEYLREHDEFKKYRAPAFIKKHCNALRIEHNLDTNITASETLLMELRGKLYYNDLKRQFTSREIHYYENKWVELIQQFRGDILPSEEMQLRQYITVDILINQVLELRRSHQQKADEVQGNLDLEEAKPPGVRDESIVDQLSQQLIYLQNSVSTHGPEYKSLLDKQRAINKDLKANRDDRIKRVEDSKESWAGLIKSLDDEEQQKRMGNDMEIMRLAKNKSRDAMAEWHTYDDGVVDQPFLNADTVKDE